MEAERTIISSKDILTTELHEIDMAIVDLVINWSLDGKYRMGVAMLIRQIKRILQNDIDALPESEKSDFTVPETYNLDDYDKWERLHINLWTLARNKGYTGVEEKKRNYKGLIKTLKQGIISDG